jgi:membrane-associated phospholipid phosphatase
MFKKGFANIKYYQAAIGLLIALIFIVIGSFKDLAISQAIASLSNPFAKFCEYFGSLPGYALLGSVGIFFLLNYDESEGKSSKLLAWACCLIFPLLAGSLYGIDVFEQAFSNRYLQALCGIALVGVFDYLIYLVVRHGDKNQAYTVGLTVLFASITVLALTYLLKKAGLRPRYLFILSENNDLSYYRNWWDFDPSVMESFPDVNSSYFESWPSGHAALSALTVLYVLFCPLNKKLQGKESYVIYGSFVFTFLISLGRVMGAAHYVSDVAFGAFFSLLFTFLVIYLVYLPAPVEELEEAPTKRPFSSFTKALSVSPEHRQALKKRTPKPRVERHRPRKKAL